MGDFSLKIKDIVKNKSFLYSFLIFQFLVVWNWLISLYISVIQDDVYLIDYQNSHFENIIILLVSGIIILLINTLIFYLAFTRLRTTTVFIPLVIIIILFIYFTVRSASLGSTFLFDSSVFQAIYLGMVFGIVFFSPAIWAYYRFRNPFISLAWLSVIFQTVLLVAEAYNLEKDSVTALLRPDLLIIIGVFYLLATLLVVIDNGNFLAKWKNTPRKIIEIPKRSIIAVIAIILAGTLIANLISPKIWDIVWERSNEGSEITQDDTSKNVSESDIPNSTGEGSAGNTSSNNDTVQIDPNQELRDDITGGNSSEPNILFTVEILEDPPATNSYSSDYISSSDMRDLLDSDNVTHLDMKTKNKPHYWKMENMSMFSPERGFYSTDLSNTSTIWYDLRYGLYGSVLLNTNHYYLRSDELVNQEYTFYQLETHWVLGEHLTNRIAITGGEPRELYRNDECSSCADTWTTESAQPWSHGDSYMVVSEVSKFDSSDPADIQTLKREDQHYYGSDHNLSYLYSEFDNPRIKQLAEKITEGAESDIEKAKKINDWFLSEFEYTLSPGSPPDLSERTAGLDRLEYFLFDNREGYCTYFASGMVAMLRSLGIESRVVGGFSEGVYSEELNSYIVTDKNAHAWVEVHTDENGWITFDPTAADPNQDQIDKQITDQLENKIEDLEDLQQKKNRNKRRLDQDPSYNPTYEPQEPREDWFTKNEEFIKDIERDLFFLVKYVLPLCLTIFFTAAFSIFPTWNLIAETKLRKSSDLSDRERIMNLFKLLNYKLKKIDPQLTQKPSETAFDFVERVSNYEFKTPSPENKLQEFAEIYNRAIFRHELRESDAERMEEILNEIEEWFEQEITKWQKLFGYWKRP